MSEVGRWGRDWLVWLVDWKVLLVGKVRKVWWRSGGGGAVNVDCLGQRGRVWSHSFHPFFPSPSLSGRQTRINIVCSLSPSLCIIKDGCDNQ